MERTAVEHPNIDLLYRARKWLGRIVSGTDGFALSESDKSPRQDPAG